MLSSTPHFHLGAMCPVPQPRQGPLEGGVLLCLSRATHPQGHLRSRHAANTQQISVEQANDFIAPFILC